MENFGFVLNSWIFLLLTILHYKNFCFASGPCALLEPHVEAKCIPLASINRAFRDAREKFGLKHPVTFPPYETHLHHDEIDQLGMVLTQTTKFLAKEFQLSHQQIYHLVPQLNLELTDIWHFCPLQFRHKACKLSKYRTITGHCNNLNNPDWGASHTPFEYLLQPERPDGVDYPKDPEENILPPARTVSSKIHRDHRVHDHAITIMLIAWGQVIDHDITFTAESKDAETHKDPDCCHRDEYGNSAHHNCYPIRIPEDDSFYGSHGHSCMNFARSISAVRPECRLGPRAALNTISSFLDASFIYGSNEHLAHKLRSGKSGMLRSLPFFTEYGLKDLLPLKIDEAEDGCIQPNPNIYCFLAGDNRVNEQLVLTLVHTIFMREHNRIAQKLSKINSHWDDEKLFQESRRVIIGIVQHITYEEFLPMVLGKQVVQEFGITIDNEGYWNGYDPEMNPSATEEFITSAFRFGHSLLPNHIERWSHNHRYIESTDLSKLLRQPFDMYRPGYADSYIMGLSNQLAQAMDEGVTEQVTTMLFKEPKKRFGMDLAAMNIQRGRDHAVPGYTAYRKLCGLPTISRWEDLVGVMKNETVHNYKMIYRSPKDIDLWSGGVSEIPSYGSLIGPTFGCIIARQFQSLRYGDRFWYELPDLPSSFTEEQLKEIKKIKLSRLLCDNSDSLKTIQVYAMVYPDPKKNPRVPCKGMVLPRINLEQWRESPPKNHNEEHHHPEHDSTHAHAHNNNEHDYFQTLQPPKYDASYLTFSNPQTFSYANASSHETTQFPQETPNYSQKNRYFVKYHSKNNYKGDVVELDQSQNKNQPKNHSAPHTPPEDFNLNDSPPSDYNNYNYNPELNYNEAGSHFEPFDTNQNIKGDLGTEYGLLETLEAPPVDSDLIFIPGERKPSYEMHPPPPPIHVHPHPPRSSHVIPSASRRRPIVRPIPKSPFPGLGGIFSPNPGYLVRQKFTTFKRPIIPPKHSMHHVLG